MPLIKDPWTSSLTVGLNRGRKALLGSLPTNSGEGFHSAANMEGAPGI